MTLSSIQTMASFSDLGIGNGLINAVAEADGRSDHVALTRAVSSAFAMLLGVAAVLGIVLAVAFPFIPWAAVTNVQDGMSGEVTRTAAVVGFTFVVGLPLGVVQRVQMGRQQGFIASAWAIAGSVLGLAGMALAVSAKATLPWVAFGAAVGPLLASLANTILTLVKSGTVRPRISAVDLGTAHLLFRLGGLFFVLQLASAVAYSADNVVVAQVIGAQAVPQYAVPMKLFGFISVLVGLAVTPLWPAYAEAIASGDAWWVKGALRRSLAATCIFSTLLATTLLIVGRPVIHLWAGSMISAPTGLLVGCAAWAVLGSAGSTCAMFMNGARVVRVQVIASVAMAVTNLLLSVWLASKIGIAGIVWGTVISYAVFVAIPYAVILPRIVDDICSAHPRPVAEGA